MVAGSDGAVGSVEKEGGKEGVVVIVNLFG